MFARKILGQDTLEAMECTSTPQSVVADTGKSTQRSRLAVDPFVV